MATAYLDINDAGIIQAIDGRHFDTSPAYAVLDRNKLLLGESARKNARLLPSWTNNRFWNQLSSDPIANGTSSIRHHADLAFAHLEDIWQNLKGQADKVVLGVPGYYTQAQLGLLLGMAKEAGIPVSGIVNSALVAVAAEESHNSILHLDISLHRISLTQLKIEDQLKVTHTVNVSETGLFTLWDRWANVVAQQYIQSSRFDPMYEAHSEQCLFDKLPAWITEHQSKPAFEMDINGVTHTAQIPLEQLSQIAQPIYAKINQSIQALSGPSTSLYISHHFEGFPGFKAAISSLTGIETHHLNATNILHSAHQYRQHISSNSDAISHTTTLPKGKSVKIEEQIAPNHLLLNHKAIAIGSGLLVSGFSHKGLRLTQGLDQGTDIAFKLSKQGKNLILESSSTRLKVNGKTPTTPTTLVLGDEIGLDNQTAILIAVS